MNAKRPATIHERERIVRTLRGERVRPLPWATRLDIWYTSRTRTGTLPAEYAGMELMDIYRSLGLGRQRYAVLVTLRLRGVDMRVEFNGQLIHREWEPRVDFPNPLGLAVADRPGDSVITFETPAGSARVVYRTSEDLIRGAAVPYMMQHILKDSDDWAVVKWILNHAEVERDFEDYYRIEKEIGDEGFTIGMVDRVPLQRILLEYMGEEHAFYQMADEPAAFHYLHDALAEMGRQGIKLALETPSLIIELPDNFDGMITSPKLFRQYCIPYIQEAADTVHAHGRLLASHVDGEMKPLLHLIPESGLDIAESFSPAPLCRCTFEEAWNAWRGKVLMWGAIPSPIFETHVPEAEFEAWVHNMLALIGDDGRIILGIGDQAVGPTLIHRVKRVSELLGRLA